MRRAFGDLKPVDQYGVLPTPSRFPTQLPPRRADRSARRDPADAHAKVAERGSGNWVRLFRAMDGNPAAHSRFAIMRLALIGRGLNAWLCATRGRSPLDALLRAELIADLGTLGEPHVVTEGQRLFAGCNATQRRLPGSLKLPGLA